MIDDDFQENIKKLGGIIGNLEALRKEDTLRLKLALDLAGIGMWDWDVKLNTLYWDRGMCQLFDEPYAANKDYNTFFTKVITEDQPRVQKAINASLSGASYEIDYTITWRDGSLHKIHARGMRYPNTDNPDKLIGVCMKLAE